jgi:DNA polymerase theta
MQSVGNRVGVIEPFLMHMAHGATMLVRGRPQRNIATHNKPAARSGGNSLINEHALRVSKRFYVALMLSRLAQVSFDKLVAVCTSFFVSDI